MSEKTTITVCMLVVAEVQADDKYMGTDAADRAAATLNDAIYNSAEKIDGKGMACFRIYGEIALGHPSLLLKDFAEELFAQKKAISEKEGAE